MNNLTTIPAKATLVEIRIDNKRFPRLHSYRREDAIYQMNMVLIMAFQIRGQQADTQSVVQMSATLIDILMEDEYGIGTRYLSFEEIKRVIRKASLGQSREMYGISVSSLFQALADYCKGEGRMADKEAKEVAQRQREVRNSIIAPMIQGHIEEMLNNSKK
jgi:predicted S18 family serine protease